MKQVSTQAAARYATGQRMRRFEELWEQASTAQRKATLPLVNKAVMGYFSGGAAASAKPLDEAIIALGNDADRLPHRKWGRCLSVVPARRLLDPLTDSLSVTIEALYPSAEKTPGSLETTISWVPGGVIKDVNPQQKPVPMLPVTLTYPLPKLDVDARLLVDLAIQGLEPTAEIVTGISLVRRLKPRLTALGTSVEPSVKALVGVLNKLAAGETLEMDYPAARLLQQAEAAAKGKPVWGKRQPGQFWLVLNSAPVRLLAPEAVKTGKPLPLVVALHGVGGSENLFFEGYGAGKLVRLCEEKGWLLLTLRNGAGLDALPALLAELGKLYPIDNKRVYLVGHSMGAAQAVATAQANPKVFAAVAALGGGGVVRSTTGLPKFFVGAGAADFGKPMAQALASSLKTTCKLYDDAEHLTVVQNALDDVIAFFEKG